jgi:LysR family transcriptional regulator, nitrogen assimilation regulatory protein
MERMRPGAWRLFVELAETGSITRLALRRNVAQPQISRQISELEELYGGRLFVRHGRGVALSELGRWALPQIRAWLAATDQLENDIRSGSGVPVGEVRIAVMPSAVRPLATSLLSQVRERYPLVRLSVREGQGGQIDDWIESGKVDIAVGYRHQTELRENDEVLAQVESYLVGPPGDTVTSKPTVRFDALAKLSLILPCRPSAWRDALDTVSRQRGHALNVVAEADSLLMQRELVARGVCHTVLGPLAIADDVRSGVLQAARIVQPALARQIVLSRHARSAASLAHRVVADLIRESAAAIVSAAPGNHQAMARKPLVGAVPRGLNV